MSMWDKLVSDSTNTLEEFTNSVEPSNFDKRSLALSDNMSQYAQGEINAGQLGLRALGDSAGLMGDAIAPIASAVTPQWVEDGIASMVQMGIQTEQGQAALKWLEANPEAAKDLGALGNIVSTLPVAGIGKMGAKAIERGVKNMPIELPGFYAGTKGSTHLAAASIVPESLGAFAREWASPQKMAKAEKGIPEQTVSVAKASQEAKVALARAKQATKEIAAYKKRGETPPPELLARAAELPPKPTAIKAQDWMVKQANKLPDRPQQIPDPQGFKDKFMNAVNKYRPAKPTMPDMQIKPKGKSQYNSFAAGQHEYNSLLHRQISRGHDKMPEAIKELFDDMGVVDSGKFDSGIVKNSFQKFSPEKWKGVNLDDEFYDTFTKVQQNGWKPGKVSKALTSGLREPLAIMKHPNMFDDLGQESLVAGSKFNRAVSSHSVKNYIKDIFPDGMKTPKDVRDVAALARITAKGDAKNLEMGFLERYVDLTQAQRNKTLTAANRKELGGMKQEVRRIGKQFKQDSKGRVYHTSTHKSSSKTMGGVQDTTAIDMDGNIINQISDEHDLFGVTLPWSNRMVNMATPNRSNLFKEIKAIPDDAMAGRKADYITRNAEKYGGEVSRTRKGEVAVGKDAMANSLETSLINYKPDVKLRHYLGTAQAETPMALAGTGLLAQREENK